MHVFHSISGNKPQSVRNSHKGANNIPGTNTRSGGEAYPTPYLLSATEQKHHHSTTTEPTSFPSKDLGLWDLLEPVLILLQDTFVFKTSKVRRRLLTLTEQILIRRKELIKDKLLNEEHLRIISSASPQKRTNSCDYRVDFMHTGPDRIYVSVYIIFTKTIYRDIPL